MVAALRSARGGDARIHAAHDIALKGAAAGKAAGDLAQMALAEGDPAVRRKLAWTLGELRDTAALDALWKLARADPDAGVRRQAVLAVVQLQPPTMDAVTAALESEEDPGVRTEWANALGRCSGQEVAQHLVDLARNDAAPAVRAAATGSLGRHCTDRADAVYLVLEDRLLRDGDPRVRSAAVYALATSGSPLAPRLLQRALDAERDPKLRATIREMMHSPEGLGRPSGPQGAGQAHR